jgi:putative Ca2+/H+ antiporter (TMEM165/GDT1 family)
MNWQTFLSTFGLVFLAELGDKTQLAVVSQTCRYRCGWAVFVGASVALTAVTGIGAAAGRLLARWIPPNVLQWGAVAAFFVMGLLVWREAVRGDEEDGELICCPAEADGGPLARWNWRAFGATAGLLFVAELGDKTQLAVLGLASQRSAPWLVFAAGSLALTAVTALGVLGGRELCRRVPEPLLLRGAALFFVVMGGLMAFGWV